MKLSIVLSASFVLALAGCSTGIESTPKITDKDVARAISQQPASLSITETKLSSTCQPFTQWQPGKAFYVTDDNARLIFNPSTDYDADTIHLVDRKLHYDGYFTGSVLDNRDIINIRFYDDYHQYVYTTGKTLDQITDNFTIPFLIDMDFVNGLNSEVGGKECFIRTPIWYNLAGDMISGRKYIKVKIQAILPGSKVYPVKAVFTALDNGQTAQVWMTAGPYKMPNRSFDALFSTDDIRQLYPAISDEIWDNISKGIVVIDMTRDECRLALGQPSTVDKQLTYGGLHELWQYNDGSYLIFEDGYLKRFRR